MGWGDNRQTVSVEYDSRDGAPITIVKCDDTGDTAEAFGHGDASLRRALASLTHDECTCGADWHYIDGGEGDD